MHLLNAAVVLISVLAHAALAITSDATKKACDEISSSLPKRVSTSFSLTYIKEVNSYWSTSLRDAKPACLVLPQSADEVSIAVKTLRKYPSVQFAVKSGGHDPNKRHSSIEDGVLISTKDLAGVTYDAETGLAYVKPGGEWNDVSGYLDEQGVAVVGGRLGLVGVGGYLLQGGISFLSAQYGLAADNIIGWEMVAANGSILNIEADKQPDLAVALRGSGSQFGIVTKFTIKAHPMGEVWGGMRIYDGSKSDEIYEALHDYVKDNSDDPKTAIILTDIKAVGGSNIFLVFYFHNEPRKPSSGSLAKFLDIKATLDVTSVQSYANLLKTNGQGAELLQSRIMFRTFTIPYIQDNPAIYGEISRKFASLVDDYLKNPLRLTSQCSIDFQPFPSIIGQHSEEAGGNAMGISGDDTDRLLLEIQCSWSNKGDDELFNQAGRDLTDWLETQLPKWTEGKEDYYLPYLMNDAAGDQNVTGTYRDYASLKGLQAQMDPDGFFSSRGGGFTY